MAADFLARADAKETGASIANGRYLSVSGRAAADVAPGAVLGLVSITLTCHEVDTSFAAQRIQERRANLPSLLTSRQGLRFGQERGQCTAWNGFRFVLQALAWTLKPLLLQSVSYAHSHPFFKNPMFYKQFEFETLPCTYDAPAGTVATVARMYRA